MSPSHTRSFLGLNGEPGASHGVPSARGVDPGSPCILGRVSGGGWIPRFTTILLAFGCLVVVFAGCSSGTLVGGQQTCRSSGGLFEKQTISCTGSVDSVRGSPRLGIVEVGDDLDGVYRLDATITVGRGTAKAFVTDTDGEKDGGELAPDRTLRITAMVEPDEDEDVEVALEVAEEEKVENLRYEARLVPQE